MFLHKKNAIIFRLHKAANNPLSRGWNCKNVKMFLQMKKVQTKSLIYYTLCILYILDPLHSLYTLGAFTL